MIRNEKNGYFIIFKFLVFVFRAARESSTVFLYGYSSNKFLV